MRRAAVLGRWPRKTPRGPVRRLGRFAPQRTQGYGPKMAPTSPRRPPPKNEREAWQRWLLNESRSLIYVGLGAMVALWVYRLATEDPLDPARVLVARAESLRRTGDLAGAAVCLEEAVGLSKEKGTPDVRFSVAVAVGDIWASLAEASEEIVDPLGKVLRAPDLAEKALECFREAQRGLNPTGQTEPTGAVYLENARRRVVALDRMGQVAQDQGLRVRAAGHFLYGVMIAVNALNPAADVKQAALGDDAADSHATTQSTTGIPPTTILGWELEPAFTGREVPLGSEHSARGELLEALAGTLYNAGVNFAEMGQMDLAVPALTRCLDASRRSEGRVASDLVQRCEDLLQRCYDE